MNTSAIFFVVCAALALVVVSLSVALSTSLVAASAKTDTDSGSKLKNPKSRPNSKLFAKDGTRKIRHVIHYMMENRALNHLLASSLPDMFGAAKPWMGMPKSTLKPKSPENFVNYTFDAQDVVELNPDHDALPYVSKTYGFNKMLKDEWGPDRVPTMDGFYELEAAKGSKHPEGVMRMYSTDKVPTFQNVTQEYATFDKFYASVTGPTWPNRAFALLGTAAGETSTASFYKGHPGSLWPGKSIFDDLRESGRPGAYVARDTPWELYLEAMSDRAVLDTMQIEDFYTQYIDTGKDIPGYTFINPLSGIDIHANPPQGSDDLHPSHSMALGQQGLAELYKRLRASPAWDSIALLVSFDEAGGFSDTVPPPGGVPSPWFPGTTSPMPGMERAFESLGPRIPFFVISRWTPKGAVISDPLPQEMPQNNSAFDLTSIIATVRKMLPQLNGTKPLTTREAWAATFAEAAFSLDEPRTDCPMELAPPPAAGLAAFDWRAEAEAPLTDLQHEILSHHTAALHGLPPSDPRAQSAHIKKQGQLSPHLRKLFAQHKEKVARWRATKMLAKHARSHVDALTKGDAAAAKRIARESKEAHDEAAANSKNKKTLPWWLLELRVTPRGVSTLGLISNQFHARWTPDFAKGTISVKANATARYCLDGGAFAPGELVGASLCHPTSDPQRNRDPSQNIIIRNDSSIGPAAKPEICLTNRLEGGSPRVRWMPCTSPNIAQHYAYHGNVAVGGGGRKLDGGQILFGDDTNELGVWALI